MNTAAQHTPKADNVFSVEITQGVYGKLVKQTNVTSESGRIGIQGWLARIDWETSGQ